MLHGSPMQLKFRTKSGDAASGDGSGLGTSFEGEVVAEYMTKPDSESATSEPELEPNAGFLRQESELEPNAGFPRQVSELSTGGMCRQETEQYWPTWRPQSQPALVGGMAMPSMPSIPYPSLPSTLPSALPSDFLVEGSIAQGLGGILAPTTDTQLPAKVFVSQSSSNDAVNDATNDATLAQKRTRKNRRKNKSLIDVAARQVRLQGQEQSKDAQASASPSSAVFGLPVGAALGTDQPKFCPYCGGRCQPKFKFCRYCGERQLE